MPTEEKVNAWINERQELYQWFMTHNLPSLSPIQGIALMRVLEAVQKAYDAEKDEKIKPILFAYINALRLVADTAAVHQKAVIDKLGLLIGIEKVVVD